MTLDDAIFDLHQKGLPSPSAISVFFLYQKINDRYRRDDNFEIKFNDLLIMQKTIQKNYSPLSSF
jgi:hypothetical protein